MLNLRPVILVLSAALMISSCSKKTHPSSPSVVILSTGEKSRPVEKPTPEEKKVDSGMGKTEPVKTKPISATPKVIIVNDRAAKKSVDGRYYYDLDGHRYWRNNKDGKYYLFNKSMYTNEDFKPKGN